MEILNMANVKDGIFTLLRSMVCSVSVMKSGMYITVGRDPTSNFFRVSFASIALWLPTSQILLMCKETKQKIKVLLLNFFFFFFLEKNEQDQVKADEILEMNKITANPALLHWHTIVERLHTYTPIKIPETFEDE